jgi:undecaprenol kinase
MKGHSFIKRMGYALHGLKLTVVREQSFRFHLLAAAAVALVLWWTRAAAFWWAVMALTVGLVMVAELFNSALETLADHLHPQRHPEIGAAKDMAAGAVLVASLIALVVAVAFVLDWVGWLEP